MQGDERSTQPPMIDPPPILKTWPRLYGAVLAALAFEIVLFYVLTRAFH